MNAEDARPTPGSGLGQTFGSGAPAWSGGIWGKSALGSSFGSNPNETARPKDENSYAGTGNAPPFEGKIGSSSLVASSESDNWTNRQSTPWNAGDAISSPALSNAHVHEPGSGSSPARTRNTGQRPNSQVLSEKPRSASPFFAARQAPIGQSAAPSSTQPHKHFLDPTSTTFTAASGNMMPGTSRTFQTSMAEDDSQRHAHAIMGALGDSQSALGGQGADYGLPGGLAHRKEHSSSSAGYLSNPYSPYAQATAGIPTHRPARSSAASSFSSQATSRKYDDLSRESQQAEMMASLARANLEDQNGQHQHSHLAGNPSVAIQPQSLPQAYDSRYRQMMAANMPQYLWAGEDGSYQDGMGTFTSDGLPEGTFAEQLNGFRLPRTNEHRSISPRGPDFRQRLPRQYYSTGGTSPAGMDQPRAPSRGGMVSRPHTSGHSALLDKKLRGLQQEQQGYMHPQPNGMMMRADAFQGQSTPNPYDCSPQSGYRVNPMLPYLPLGGMSARPPAPRGPSRDQDLGNNLRSALLEDFRSNAKTSKRYELKFKDIFNHVVEFSGDQHGSRFIQQKLETANSDEKDQVFLELKPNSLQLMADVFGNYVIQKFFEHGTQQQKTVLADQMKGHILNLSLQMYGCRVVQKALEHILVDQQAALVKELDVHVLKCVKDQNGNHVIQKAIERVPPEHIQFIINAFTGQVHSLATHPYGCRVIQRMLEYCQGEAQASILQELHACTYALVVDQYGNYVTQHVIEHGKEEDRGKIIGLITSQLVHFSKHKFASNVVEKSIQFGSDEQRREMMAILTVLSSNGSSPLQGLIRDQYGNYVIQKLLGQMKGTDFESLVECIKPQLAALKKYTYGKQISAVSVILCVIRFSLLSRSQIEKIIYTSATPSQATGSPLDTSAAPTPPLSTTEAQSPQSSSLPSTNTSTVEGPVKSEAPEKAKTSEEKIAIATATTS
ncbi:MAG: mRNA binding protein puf3 [Thelocarpon impressellum]|nr:MAG: mRNA binding protein puf3 [Thelocarpon impressellum]